MRLLRFHPAVILGVLLFFIPQNAYASVESTLTAIQTRLITTILPLVGILGLAFAGISFAVGSPNAKQRAIWAAVGAVIGFGAPSIIAFIRQLVH